MTQDIVERLRSQFHLTQGDGLNALLATGDEAADLIELLRAALEPFAVNIREGIKDSQSIDTICFSAAQHRAACDAVERSK